MQRIRGARGRDGACRRGAEFGFTLLELLAVLLILATAFAITLPALTAGSGTEIQAAVRTVAAGLRQSRDRAITTNRPAVLLVDVERKQITLGERSRQLPRNARVGLFTARSEQLDEHRGTIRFFPDGASTGGRITIATDARSFLVDVDWLTGRISILEGDPEDWDLPTAFAPVRLQ